MSAEFQGWKEVARRLRQLADGTAMELRQGQRASLHAMADRIGRHGVILADEVGMGKTRIAAAVAKAVIDAGGRVAILVPPGLGYQWRDELRSAHIDTPPMLRSFWQFLQAWEDADAPRPWFAQRALLVSHAFTNWRLGEHSASWRWALLPELYARLRKLTHGCVPGGYHDHARLDDAWVKNAAKSIADAAHASAQAGNGMAGALIQQLRQETPWPGALEAGAYERDAQLRPLLEQAVGLGLGMFDLVIIDEAHKSRGQQSGLNRLLEQVVLHTRHARRLALTATPVELDMQQWVQALGRIQVDGAAVSAQIAAYAQAVCQVRQCPSDALARAAYQEAAQHFTQALAPYLLRRDKREEPSVLQFQRYTGEGFHAYRQEKEILLETATLPTVWKQAVCAAEALSFVTQHKDSPIAKRLRLTLGNGHGVAAWLDQLHHHERDDHRQCEDDARPRVPGEGNSVCDAPNDKQLQRAQWWQQVLMQTTQGSARGEAALYEHPAILAAVTAVEAVCQRGEKVLVFGRFTRPLRALVELLNARAMLRSVQAQQLWPQSKVGDAAWPAVAAAQRQLQLLQELGQEGINQLLDAQYQLLEEQRRQGREKLIARLEQGLAEIGASTRVQAIFGALQTAVAQHTGTQDGGALALVARAIQELLQESLSRSSTHEIARAFTDLIEAASDHDAADADSEEAAEMTQPAAAWMELEGRLREIYARAEGGFARLMHGETKPSTRRFLQLAFNRRYAHPKVLVAQSVVGREGLNMHQACRTVILLHPEWNPGVVEQQIGRVDRMGSWWEQKLEAAIKHGMAASELPRIEVCPIVFQGTYDEMNWQVLRARWDALRAQLHGVVISPHIAKKYVGDQAAIAEINRAAPNFSPWRSGTLR